MNIRAEPHIVGEIVSDVIGIFVDHNLIVVPQPITAIGEVDRSDAEIKSTEPESIRTAARQVPHVPASESACEMAMLPGAIDVISRIVAPAIVADPLSVVVDVRGFGMPLAIRIAARIGWTTLLTWSFLPGWFLPRCFLPGCFLMRRLPRLLLRFGRLGPALGNISATDVAVLLLLLFGTLPASTLVSSALGEANHRCHGDTCDDKSHISRVPPVS